MNRVTTLRQEARPSKYSSLVVDHHKPYRGEIWIARAHGFVAGIVVAALMLWLTLH